MKHFFKIFLAFVVASFFCACDDTHSTKSESFIKKISAMPNCDAQSNLQNAISHSSIHPFVDLDSIEIQKACLNYWLKVDFHDSVVGQQVVISSMHVDTIDLYLPIDENHFIKKRTGEDIKFSQRPIKYGEYPCLAFTIPKSKRIYLKMSSNSNYSVEFRNFKKLKVVSERTFVARMNKSRYYHGIFMGIMIAMIIYNIIIYFWYNDSAFAVYVVFMITQTLYHLSITGFLKEFVFVNYPALGKQTPFLIAGISLASYIWFVRVYLNSSKHSPRLDTFLKILYPIVFFTTLLGLYNWASRANSVLLLTGVLIIVLAFFIALSAYRQKYRPAIFFLVASMLSFMSYIVFVLLGLKIIPEIFITRYAFQIFFAVQSLLFAMGLGDRMNGIRKELALKKIEKERLEKEQEIKLKNVLERQNELLEVKVKQRTAELEEKNKLIAEDREIIQKERQKSDLLLRNILPDSIAGRLKTGEEMIAEHFEDVSVFFSDIVGFTTLSQEMAPSELVSFLNVVFTSFDKLAEKHGMEKIKTIGDAYMCVCGLPVPLEDHTERMAAFASDILVEVAALKGHNQQFTGVRIGVHRGPVVAGVIGKQKFAYDLWGETVNIASRLESQGESMKIHCSEEFIAELKNKYHFKSNGLVDLKGIGPSATYFLQPKEN